MGSVVLHSLSLLLGLFFIFVGAIKLSGYFSEELFKDSKKEFAKYAKVFPLSQIIGFKVPPRIYRKAAGYLEVICGLSLAITHLAILKRTSNIVLIAWMLLKIYSHYRINDRFERIAPALVFIFMLIGRLIIEWQVKKQAELSTRKLKNEKHD